MSYPPRDSINPRAFAVRHALLEELKRRAHRASNPVRAVCAEFARSLEVQYDPRGRHFVVLGLGPSAVEVPLDAFQFYQRRPETDDALATRADPVCTGNRARAAGIIDAALAQLNSSPETSTRQLP